VPDPVHLARYPQGSSGIAEVRIQHLRCADRFRRPEAGCKTLYSEDLQDGQIINRQLTIRIRFDEVSFRGTAFQPSFEIPSIRLRATTKSGRLRGSCASWTRYSIPAINLEISSNWSANTVVQLPVILAMFTLRWWFSLKLCLDGTIDIFIEDYGAHKSD